MKYDSTPYLTLYLAIITRAVADMREIAQRDDITLRYKRKKVRSILSWLKHGVDWETLNIRPDDMLQRLHEEVKKYGI